MLPYALLSLWINILGSILLAGLAGHELITHRNYVVFAGSAFYLVFGVFAGAALWTAGVGFRADRAHAACFLVTWFLLRRTIPRTARDSASLGPGAVSRNVRLWRRIFNLLRSRQAVREPVTKALLAKFGGLAMTGFYDMASRWVFTFRELIVQANLVLVPTISGLRERDAEAIPADLPRFVPADIFFGGAGFRVSACRQPDCFVDAGWGATSLFSCSSSALLAAGWLVNILSNPAYVVDLGTGALRWVSIGCACTGDFESGAGIFGGANMWRRGGGGGVACCV